MAIDWLDWRNLSADYAAALLGANRELTIDDRVFGLTAATDRIPYLKFDGAPDRDVLHDIQRCMDATGIEPIVDFGNGPVSDWTP